MTLEELEEQIKRMKRAGVPRKATVLVQIPEHLEGWTWHRFSTNFPGEGRCDWRAVQPHQAVARDIDGASTCVIFIDY